jgi:hypothetical protein
MNIIKFKNNFVLIIFLFVFFAGITFGQRTELKRYMIIRTVPSYTLLFNLNYNQSVLELSGTFNDDVRSQYIYDGQTFGADKGYGAAIVSKISIDERSLFRFNQSVAFNRLLSYTFGDKELADHGKANYNAFTGSLGLEYNFTPSHRFKIYLGGELNASMINGDMTIWFERRGNPLGDSTASYSISNSIRMGYGFNAGSEYTINKDLGLNFGVKFLNLNAFLRKAEGSNDDAEFKLRDDDNPGLRFAGKKNFSFYSIFAGVNLYFGVGEKRYKLK